MYCIVRRANGAPSYSWASGIGLGDYLIAATTDVKGYQLATLNVRHFPMFKGLRPPFAVSPD